MDYKMFFDAPTPFNKAIAALDAKNALPTSLSSQEIRDQWSADLRERSFFSARMNSADAVQGAKNIARRVLAGEFNMATARAEMQDLLDSLGYTPEEGFEGIEDDIPPAERGSLRDLSSNKRTGLMLQTNVRQMANFAFKKEGETDYALFAFPCWELVRIYPRRIPRGEKLEKGVIVPAPGEDWPSRWVECGGVFYEGRMIARKDDPIWQEIGSRTRFNDALDANYPPFAYNSGYGWTEPGREECIELGVIDHDTVIEGSASSMNEGLKAAAKFETEFLKVLRDKFNIAIKDDIATLRASGDASADYLERQAFGKVTK